MTAQSGTIPRQWTRQQAAFVAVACLLAGVGGGWFLGGLRHPAPFASSASIVPSPPKAQTATPVQPDAAQLKAAADAQAAPLIDRLRSDAGNPALLTEAGNIYYDARQYPVAVDYYLRALKAKPADAAVRTDMATAYWYMGEADRAIAEFDRALGYAPDNPNTLFNRGLVRWRAKKDAAGALADWQRLLATDPAYEQKDKVREMIAEVQKQQALPAAPKAQ